MQRASVQKIPERVTTGHRLLLYVTTGLTVIAFSTLHAGCAGSKPSLSQPGIRNKLDLRLQSALGATGADIGESLGEYIRVSIRMKSDGTEEDLALLNQLGVAGAFLGPVTTLTLEPSKVVEVAALKRVRFIELESTNVPKPTPPPPPAEGMSR